MGLTFKVNVNHLVKVKLVHSKFLPIISDVHHGTKFS